MNVVPSMSVGAVLALLIVAQPALAEQGWLSKLNPFEKKEKSSRASGRTYPQKKAKPSALAKLNSSTKKFFAGTRDVLTGKKKARKKPANQTRPWIRNPEDPRYAGNEKKKSWFDSLFRREEPKPVQSMEDWVGLPRVKP